MQAITTKVLPATTTKDRRIKATTASGLSITLGWDHELGNDQNHITAAKALVKKMGWDTGRYYGGTTATGMVFVQRQLDLSFN